LNTIQPSAEYGRQPQWQICAEKYVVKRIYIARNTLDVKALLEDAGIKAVVEGARLASLVGEVPADIGAEIWVFDDANLQRAAEVLRKWERTVTAKDAQSDADEGENAVVSEEITAEGEEVGSIVLSPAGRNKAWFFFIVAVAAAATVAISARPPQSKGKTFYHMQNNVRFSTPEELQRIITVARHISLKDSSSSDEGLGVNQKDTLGQALLHYAVEYRRVELAELLLNRGADVNVGNWCGKTPLDLALENQDAAIAELLKKHGGRCKEELSNKLQK
jgi:hypothetical protein